MAGHTIYKYLHVFLLWPFRVMAFSDDMINLSPQGRVWDCQRDGLLREDGVHMCNFSVLMWQPEEWRNGRLLMQLPEREHYCQKGSLVMIDAKMEENEAVSTRRQPEQGLQPQEGSLPRIGVEMEEDMTAFVQRKRGRAHTPRRRRRNRAHREEERQRQERRRSWATAAGSSAASTETCSRRPLGPSICSGPSKLKHRPRHSTTRRRVRQHRAAE